MTFSTLYVTKTRNKVKSTHEEYDKYQVLWEVPH